MTVTSSWMQAGVLAMALATAAAAATAAGPSATAYAGARELAARHDDTTLAAHDAAAPRHADVHAGQALTDPGEPGARPATAEPSTLALALAGIALVGWAVLRGRRDTA